MISGQLREDFIMRMEHSQLGKLVELQSRADHGALITTHGFGENPKWVTAQSTGPTESLLSVQR